MIALIIIIAILIAYWYYCPYVDVEEDQVILWYNKNSERKYIILWKK